MTDAQVAKIVQAIHETGSTNLLFAVLLMFIASYLGWMARRIKELNDTLKTMSGRQEAPPVIDVRS